MSARPPSMTASLVRVAAWCTATTLLGAAFGATLAGLAAGLAIALARQYWQLHALLADLHGQRRLGRSAGHGVIADIRFQLYRRQREAQRRRQRLHGLLQAFRRAADSMPDGVVVLARGDLAIQWFNPAASQLLGLQRRDVGLRLPNLLRTPAVARWLDDGAGEPLLGLPAPHDESIRLLLRMIDYTPDAQLLVVRNISKLLQLETMRRDFVANVSHELRTPLTVIHGYLDLLDPAEHRELAPVFAEMQRQSARMARLVEDLLTLSRLDARERLDEEPVAMAPMLATLVREAEALSGGRHRIVLGEQAALDLLGSVNELHSAFSNLVANAVRYTPDGGSVRIDFRAEPDGGARLAVSDSGPGIAAQHLPRITERFYRVSNSRSRESGGTGLGLAIVKHVLQLHRAELQVDSQLGIGSCFSCVFDPAHVRARGDALPVPRDGADSQPLATPR